MLQQLGSIGHSDRGFMSDFSTYLFTQGVLGFVVLALGIACIKLYNSREADRKEWRAEVKDLNQSRLQDSKDIGEKVTGVLNDTSTNVRILSEKIVSGRVN